MTTIEELALLRLAGQLIAGPGAASAHAVVHRLGAVQAQDRPGAVSSVALRTRARSRRAVEDAMTAGAVVRSWPMRGTLHLVAAEDLTWLLALTAARQVVTQAPRRAQLGLDAATLGRAEQVATGLLAGGRELSRAGLLAGWEQAGLGTAGQRGYHLIAYLAQAGVLCFGPVRDGEQQLVLVAEWVTPAVLPDRPEALARLASRYFHGHGPAGVQDFARWSKLVAADVRAAVASARPDLAAVTVDGVEYLMDPRTPDRLARCRDQARGVFLLPGFDEYLLGYGDRRAVLAPEFAERIVPGRNGVFRPTVVVAGQVLGTWHWTGRGPARTRQVDFFAPVPAAVAAAVAAAAEADLP